MNRKTTAMADIKERYGDTVSADYLAGVGTGVEWADSNPKPSPCTYLIDKEIKPNEKIIIKCVEDNSRIPNCALCCFYRGCYAPCPVSQCTNYKRTDGKNVHFEICVEG